MSLFKRPAWAKQQPSGGDEETRTETNIFSHSHSYQDIVAEQERRKREKAERKKLKSERRTSEKREIQDEPIDDGTAKRRRITTEESEKLLRSVGLPTRADPSDEDEPVAQGTPVRRSPRLKMGGGSDEPTRVLRGAVVVDLGDSSEEDNHDTIQTTPGASRKRPSALVEEIQDDPDDEFAELARKARLRRQQSNNRSLHTPKPGITSPSPGVSSEHDTSHDRPPDPVIQLFIDSPLPNTNPLIVQRKLGQSTGPIREAWCQKQGFTKEFSDGVFFVHRMRRVYDVTTCRSLGLEVDQYGNVSMRGAEGKEGVNRVHLVAVTDDAFKQLKKEKETQDRSGEVPAEGGQQKTPPPEKEESNIKVVLRAKGQADFRLKVKPTTQMRQIASAYAKKVLHHGDRQVRLEFDGEDLDPEACMQDTEIEDMDIVSVHMV